MIDIAVYPREPDRITYTPRADGGADVWLRRNIVKSADGEDEWTADEVYFHTTMSRADVDANFDTLFERDKLLNPGTDVESRIADLEEALYMILEGETM